MTETAGVPTGGESFEQKKARAKSYLEQKIEATKKSRDSLQKNINSYAEKPAPKAYAGPTKIPPDIERGSMDEADWKVAIHGDEEAEELYDYYTSRQADDDLYRLDGEVQEMEHGLAQVEAGDFEKINFYLKEMVKSKK